MLTFFAGVSVALLVALAVRCLVAGVRDYRIHRVWVLIEQQWFVTAHSAL